jgi:4-hydroxy-tetrahydrodipicolinate reductase
MTCSATDPIRLLLFGAAGRMGQAVLSVLPEYPQVELVVAVSRSDHPLPPGIPVFPSTALAGVPEFDVAIDFSLAPAFSRLLELCLDRRAALVSGTTGLSSADRHAIEQAGTRIPLLWSSNFSIGAAVLCVLAERAARLLADWECEIVETHHRRKIDAPSGTALALAESVARGRGEDTVWRDRIGSVGPRTPGTIGIASLRGGDVVGEHVATLFSEGERIELGHRAQDRRVFARGAVRAAHWIAGREPGIHQLADLVASELAD